ncbi:MAG TPA: hypothetical protein PLC52_05345 [Anaerolineales bacterium]|nr:hypothetical protein [Anaerolineales bacterium]HRQ92273.1 hypothetical protein [Anaerolineales bacterium]
MQKMIVSATLGTLFLNCLTILLLKISLEVLFTFRSTPRGDLLVVIYIISLPLFALLALYFSPKSYSVTRNQLEEFSTKMKLPLLGGLIQSFLVGAGILGGALIVRSGSNAPIYLASFTFYVGAVLFLLLGVMGTHRYFTILKALREGELTVAS